MESSLKMSDVIKVSTLGKTWILDLDGTVVKHNGYKIDGEDTLLPNAAEFFRSTVSEKDMVIFVTSRTSEQGEKTERFLQKEHIPYDHIIYGAPYGERILINDKKPSGLGTAIAVNTERDQFINAVFVRDDTL